MSQSEAGVSQREANVSQREADVSERKVTTKMNANSATVQCIEHHK